MAEVVFFNPNVSRAGIPLRLYVDINWTGDAAQRLVAASYRLHRFELLTRTIGRKVVTSVRRGIMEGKDIKGAPFQPLKNPRAPGHNQSNKPLYDKGEKGLYGDIRFKMISDREVMVGHTRLTWYGLLHQRGVPHPWTITAKNKKVLRFWTAEGWQFRRSVRHPGLVQRAFLGIRPGDLPDVRKILGDWAGRVFDPAATLSFGEGSMEGE